MISKPLYQNPLAGGYTFKPIDDSLKPGFGLPLTLESAGPSATGGTFNGMPLSSSNFNISNANFNATLPDELGPQLIDPGAEAQKKADEEFLKTADEYQKGFRQSEFYKPGAAMTADVAEFIYKSPTGEDITMKGSSSGIGQFGKYLDSIGKGDLLQSVGGSFSSDLLGKVNPNDPDPLAGAKQGLFPIKNEKGEDIGGIENTATVNDPYDLGSLEIGVNPIISSGDEYEIASEQGVGQDIFGNNPSVIPVPSTPNPVQGIGLDGQPLQTTGQYLTDPNEDDNVLETLKNIEQGIASLGANYGQEGNMNQSSNYGDFKNFGIGSFFPPYGGMYG